MKKGDLRHLLRGARRAFQAFPPPMPVKDPKVELDEMIQMIGVDLTHAIERTARQNGIPIERVLDDTYQPPETR